MEAKAHGAEAKAHGAGAKAHGVEAKAYSVEAKAHGRGAGMLWKEQDLSTDWLVLRREGWR